MVGYYLPIVAHCFLIFMLYCNGVDFTKGLSNGFFGILNFSSKIFIEGMCVVALVHVVMTTNGSTFHLCWQ